MQQAPEEPGREGRLFEELVQLVRHLRSEDGCPWDRKQTMESMIECLEEETEEVIEAVESGDMENLKEELGDLLLQSVFFARIAQEEGTFDVQDVLRHLNEKLVRRHPHVFGDVEATTAEEARASWDDAKASEKQS